jgi:hypothetical protein
MKLSRNRYSGQNCHYLAQIIAGTVEKDIAASFKEQ